MKNYLKHIDDFFREKLGRYSETPPSDIWESLEGRLDTLVPQAPQMPNAYRWLKHFGMVSLIAVLVVPFLKKINGNSAVNSVQAKEEVMNPVATGNENSTTTNSESVTKDKNDMQAERSLIADATGKTGHTDNNINNAVTNNVHSSKSVTPSNSHSEAMPYAPQHSKKPNSHRNTVANKANPTAALYRQPAQQNVNNPNSNLSIPGPADEIEETIDATSQAKNVITPGSSSKAALPEEKKKENTVVNNEKKKEEAKDNKNQLSKPGKFEAGVKIGYERGTNDLVATKYVIAPYLQYKLSDKFSLMAQPAVKFASVNSHNIGTPKSYYKANDDGTVTQNGTTQKGYIMEGGSIADSSFTTNYTYRRSHDSIVKSYVHGGSYTEFELPVLLKYTVLPKLSLYGGVNINYSKQIAVTENTYTKKGMMQSVDSTTTSFGAPGHLAVNDVIRNTGSTYSDHTAPVYTNAQSSSLRFGYMVGFSYEYSKKWMVDVLMQQTPVKPYLQGGYNMNSTLSAPYFRLSVGYKLTK